MTNHEFAALRDLIQAEIRMALQIHNHPGDRPRLERETQEHRAEIRNAYAALVGDDMDDGEQS